MNKVQLDRIAIDSPEAARRVREGVPFVTHVEWPAMKLWSPAYLGDRVVPKEITMYERTPDGRKEVEISFREFTNIIFDPGWGEHWEIPGAPQTRLWFDGKPDPNLGVLLEDIVFPPLVDQSRLFGITMFPGAGGFDNGMHYDGIGMLNLNVQVFGRKRWSLFHPRYAGVFEAATALDTSMAPPFLPGDTKHPLACASNPGFDEVVCHEAELGPGDGIFVPTYWMHWVVYGSEASLGCNFWWHTPQFEMSGAAAAAAMVNSLLILYRRKMPGATLTEIAAELDRLPLETRELLRDLERTMIYDRRLVESPTLFLGLRKEAVQLPGGQLVAGHFEKSGAQVNAKKP